ncbi:hypothetical protein KOW79_018771 [Hemibagrus wyckioides]|uniref:Chemokine interleukin-8-like domain-containing protein n=1 Tax=Hemibagrus wyckioides TaxID=337641 RepID=A0A9D3SAT8_9TELE|nr:hypothetical protein KOW79_018771 [Hemibagrus wyckioides]
MMKDLSKVHCGVRVKMLSSVTNQSGTGEEMRTALLCLFAVLLTATVCQSIKNPCVCLKISNTIVPAIKIKKYYLQKSGLCYITAAVLTTMKGYTVCADPKKAWVMKAMKLVDAKGTEHRVITAGGSHSIR